MVKAIHSLKCIDAVDGCILDRRVLRGSFGTTKYCNYFIRGVPCNNNDCLYLHDACGDDDSFTHTAHILHGQ